MVLVPYQHQKECIRKLGKPELPSRLIADDMGLGKTFEALWIDDELRSERYQPDSNNRRSHPAYKRPTLIVAPKATHRDAWLKAIRQLESLSSWDDDALDRAVAIIDSKDRSKLLKRLKQKPEPMFVILHYEALRLMPELKDIEWFHIIADEVHRVKNRKSQQSVALKALKAHYKTGLSGTPADDKPQDIWSVLNWLYPKDYRSYWKFVNAFCTQEAQEIRGGRSFRKITGVNREKIPQLHAQWSRWYIRRTKEETLDDLPPKTYTEMYVDLLPGQRRAYEQMRKDMVAWIGERKDQPLVATIAVAQLVRLQQFALATVDFSRANGRVTLVDPSSKIDRLIEIVDGNPNESLVVFTQSRSMVELVVKRLRAHDISALPYHGNVSERDRDKAVQSFQGGWTQVFVGTIAAGSEGITLHRASNMVFLDRMWNPTRNRQAEDREHRIGQQNAVQIIDIMARDTVDRGKNQRVANKWDELLYLLGDKKMTITNAAKHDAVSIFLGGK